jgi:hypothetical protein
MKSETTNPGRFAALTVKDVLDLLADVDPSRRVELADHADLDIALNGDSVTFTDDPEY